MTKNWTGKDLVALGLTPGAHFGKCLHIINSGEYTDAEVIGIVTANQEQPKLPLLDTPAPCVYNITAETPYEKENLAGVKAAMDVLLRVPVVIEAAIMPDACSAGIIPVGGVVATRNAILPGLHSADICCSLTATIIEEDVDLKTLLDTLSSVSHFGPGGRNRDRELRLDPVLRERILANPLLNNGKLRSQISSNFGTSGDGNHFIYVGRLESTGKAVIVSHHGSRGPGAFLYKEGMRIAEKFRQKLSPATPKGAAWIPSQSSEGMEYWDALQLIREWTKASHAIIHDSALNKLGLTIHHRRWNEHNFVFKEVVGEDEIFWHAKGATPIHNAFLPDTDGVQILPLNMKQPILFIKSERNERNRGFAPHGAGRNMSRTKHKALYSGKSDEEIFAEETVGIDARFHSGIIDISELPSAYKDADRVQADMELFGLADVVDRVLPFGSIMAGDWEQNAPWRKGK